MTCKKLTLLLIVVLAFLLNRLNTTYNSFGSMFVFDPSSTDVYILSTLPKYGSSIIDFLNPLNKPWHEATGVIEYRGKLPGISTSIEYFNSIQNINRVESNSFLRAQYRIEEHDLNSRYVYTHKNESFDINLIPNDWKWLNESNIAMKDFSIIDLGLLINTGKNNIDSYIIESCILISGRAAKLLGEHDYGTFKDINFFMKE